MKITQWAATAAVVTLASVTLAACGGDDSSENSAGTTQVRVAFTPGATTLPVHLADKLGYFQDRGLDVRITNGLDLPTWAAGLGKQWDVAMQTPGVYLQSLAKLDNVIVAGGQVTTEGSLSGNPLIVRGDDIKDASDLEGKRVGVGSLTGSSPASIQYLVKKAGGDPTKVELVQVPFDAAGDQLKAGQLDATVSSVPFSVQLLKDPENTALFDVQDRALRDLDPDQEVMASIVYASQRDWATKNSEAAQGFQDALSEAEDYMVANKEEALAELQSWLKLPDGIVGDLPWPIPTQADIGLDEFKPTVDLFLATGLYTDANVPDVSDRFPFE